MEPKQPGSGGGVERVPAPKVGETGNFQIGEQISVRPEQETGLHEEVGAVQAEAAQIAMPVLPVPVATQSDDTSTQTASDATQLTAGDDDLIEKEWIDKAKRVIAETKDDPYKREREISKLQIEYIRKRYGRVIGDAGD